MTQTDLSFHIIIMLMAGWLVPEHQCGYPHYHPVLLPGFCWILDNWILVCHSQNPNVEMRTFARMETSAHWKAQSGVYEVDSNMPYNVTCAYENIDFGIHHPVSLPLHLQCSWLETGSNQSAVSAPDMK